jgi:hypothetical protein
VRILVCGGRDYDSYDTIARVLDEYGDDTVIIHGAARGADALADQYATVRRWPAVRFPANWTQLGRGAGSERNARMLRDGKPDLVIAFPGGRGTADMVTRARRAGVPVLEVAP